jgi:hypothetical protein
MTEPLSALLEAAADDLARDVPVPPAAGVMAAGRRRRRMHVTVPAVVAPLLVAAAVVAVVAAPNLLFGDGDRARTVFAGDVPELGRIPMPAAVNETVGPGRDDPPVGDQADLLAVTVTKDGRARLFGFTRRSGTRCVAQDYENQFLNSYGGAACGPGTRDPLARTPLSLGGHVDGTPGTVKAAPITYGSAPPGTRTVRLSAAGRPAVTVDARDAGSRYGHRAYFLTSWPMNIAFTALALDENGHELARYEQPPPSAEQTKHACDSAAAVLLSHLQRASHVGQAWAEKNPESANPSRLAFPNGLPLSAGLRRVDEQDAIARYRTALADVGVMGPQEVADFRRGAVVVVGDGKNCFDNQLVAAATAFLRASAA